MHESVGSGELHKDRDSSGGNPVTYLCYPGPVGICSTAHRAFHAWTAAQTETEQHRCSQQEMLECDAGRLLTETCLYLLQPRDMQHGLNSLPHPPGQGQCWQSPLQCCLSPAHPISAYRYVMCQETAATWCLLWS